MEIKVIVAIVGISGILIAAILSSLGYFYRSNVEVKKSARKVLFFLLEIRYAIITSLFDPNEATRKYIVHYINRIKEKNLIEKTDDIEAIKKVLADMINSHFINLSTSIKTDLEDKLLIPYEKSLIEFASVNPVLAYKLNGKDKIEQMVSHINDYQDKVQIFLNDINMESLLSDKSNELKNEAVDELYKDLESDILLLSKYCSRYDYLECKKTFKSGITNSNQYDFNEMDKKMDQVLNEITVLISEVNQR